MRDKLNELANELYDMKHDSGELHYPFIDELLVNIMEQLKQMGDVNYSGPTSIDDPGEFNLVNIASEIDKILDGIDDDDGIHIPLGHEVKSVHNMGNCVECEDCKENYEVISVDEMYQRMHEWVDKNKAEAHFNEQLNGDELLDMPTFPDPIEIDTTIDGDAGLTLHNMGNCVDNSKENK